MSASFPTGVPRRRPRHAARTARGGTASCALAVAFSLSALLMTAVAETRAPGFYATPFERRPPLATLASLGRLVFMDPSLSASGATSCSSCHDPSHAFGPPNAEAVQRAGADRVTSGVRAAPSLSYTQSVPPFTEHFFDDDGNDSEDQGPAGGRTWDGRAATVHEQARLPFFSPLEMANASDAELVGRAAAAPYAGEFRAAFGAHFFEDPAIAMNGMLLALEVFEQTPAEFYPYSSKYDAWLRGEIALSAEEERGRAVFIDPARGNCEHCHPSGMRSGMFPQFTDYGYVALGLPRNRAIPANADAGYFDLGLCGPLRTDLTAHAAYCGLFRTPSLRNVALRRAFYHNGVAATLGDAVRFYAERDTHPEKWYPRAADGTVDKFDDLPAKYRRNVEVDVPFGQAGGGSPSLTERDVDDLVAFLNTLTDGFSGGKAAAAQAPKPRPGTDAKPAARR